jgi:hypothetical protein
MPKPLPLPRVVHDTTRTPYPVYIKGETHYVSVVVYKDTVAHSDNRLFKTSDSLNIDTLGIKGKVSVAVTLDSLKAKFDWRQQLQLPDLVHIIDSVFVPQIVLQNKPVLQDGWFYGSVGLFLLSLLYLIGIL